MEYAHVCVVGGGLAGCEAAWRLANQGTAVELWEMRPGKMTPAHHTGELAELVCSNSFRAASLENAAGLLKEEMRLLDSLLMKCAAECSVPAGGALAVDRHLFGRSMTQRLEEHENIMIRRTEVEDIPGSPAVIATGPLSSPAITDAIAKETGQKYLYFYDAAAPIVTAESIDWERAFEASRYGKGEGVYVNCPLDEEEYEAFYSRLVTAETHPLHEFEERKYFEGCMPVEVLARRGRETLLFGPMKPVGLVDPHTGGRPFAVVQLRRENLEGTMYNLVGFQTNLRWAEQKRVFSMIPALREAEFVRYGVMHRNTYINSPQVLRPTLETRSRPGLFFAGQVTGVEGYIESAATGIVAGINAARALKRQEGLEFPETTAIGALCRYVCMPNENFQPMNVNFGLLPPLKTRERDKRQRNLKLSFRALEELKVFKKEHRL